jgi:hypothetical protein
MDLSIQATKPEARYLNQKYRFSGYTPLQRNIAKTK